MSATTHGTKYIQAIPVHNHPILRRSGWPTACVRTYTTHFLSFFDNTTLLNAHTYITQETVRFGTLNAIVNLPDSWLVPQIPSP